MKLERQHLKDVAQLEQRYALARLTHQVLPFPAFPCPVPSPALPCPRLLCHALSLCVHMFLCVCVCQVSVFTEGVLAMKTTLVGIIKLGNSIYMCTYLFFVQNGGCWPESQHL